ncbi:pyruvate dehydrogenase complex dihydrolipoamide acetyltransferase [Paenalcaligenes suwonensis]|uniref:pyruvate dehydrogenase complex dihydrolipoamide acetyltransferase n=1 Tax=Paenalcaligenes suwonensis TaxID=1202713 RepID=UPI001409FC68|nr:pyruvate dehydrogenase complex dihydrolipoamide acetyltransferase [Paenalcaligenes suwonensis]NHC61464.1 pyruvate dehydrogenase complex dihydrolipoamide acetyltransferase [Paenalcaligenes suwonensis]
MATLITMPGVAAGNDAAQILSWLKKEGEAVNINDELLEVETDKAVVEVAAEASGTLARILVPAGQSAEVGAPIAVILATGEGDAELQAALAGIPSAAPAAATTEVAAPVAVTPAVAAPAANSTPSENTTGRIFASPLARRLAQEAGLNLSTLHGSGPHGRIIKNDVLKAQAQQPATVATTAAPAAAPVASNAAYTAQPHSAMRRTIARRLTESKSTVPHFYLQAECRVDALLALRAQINQTASQKVSVNDLIVKAVAVTLQAMPEMNVSWTDEALLQYHDVDISVAVSTDSGLITPVVRNANNMSLSALSQNVRQLAERARDGKLQPNEYQGGSFTISNLGMYGVQNFAAIINPPQAAILAVGAAERRVIAEGDDMVIAQMLSMTLSVDHRAIDGALAARWLARFKETLEAPLSILI